MKKFFREIGGTLSTDDAVRLARCADDTPTGYVTITLFYDAERKVFFKQIFRRDKRFRINEADTQLKVLSIAAAKAFVADKGATIIDADTVRTLGLADSFVDMEA